MRNIGLLMCARSEVFVLDSLHRALILQAPLLHVSQLSLEEALVEFLLIGLRLEQFISRVLQLRFYRLFTILTVLNLTRQLITLIINGGSVA